MTTDVFRALADPSRRALLDVLRRDGPQTLSGLCAHVTSTRQAVTQHLQVLEAANLVVVTRRGRERWHHLNAVPLHEIAARWLSEFDAPRLTALAAIREHAESLPEKGSAMADLPQYVYVTYIRAGAQQVWEALTSADLTARYWGHRNESDWQVGSVWNHVRPDGSGVADVTGVVLAAEPPHRLVVTFGDPEGEHSVVTFTVDPWQDLVRLTVVHENLPTADDVAAVSLGWPAVLANLKSLLETGETLPQDPWEMPA